MDMERGGIKEACKSHTKSNNEHLERERHVRSVCEDVSTGSEPSSLCTDRSNLVKLWHSLSLSHSFCLFPLRVWVLSVSFEGVFSSFQLTGYVYFLVRMSNGPEILRCLPLGPWVLHMRLWLAFFHSPVYNWYVYHDDSCIIWSDLVMAHSLITKLQEVKTHCWANYPLLFC